MCNTEDEYSPKMYELFKILKDRTFAVKSRMSIKETDGFKKNCELKDAIEKSRIILFVLTNNYFKSSEFIELFQMASLQNKIVVYLLAEEIDAKQNEIIDLNSLNVIEIYKNFNKESICTGEPFYRLCYLLYSTIGRQDLVSKTTDKVKLEPYRLQPFAHFNENLQRYRKLINGFEIKKNLIEKTKQIGRLYDFTERNQVLITIGDRLLIYQPYSFKFERQIRLHDIPESDIRDICYQRNTNTLCLLGDNSIYFLDENYRLIRVGEIGLCQVRPCSLQTFTYNEANNKMYLYDGLSNEIMFTERLLLKGRMEIRGSKTCLKSMKIINNNLYLLKNDSIYVYDLDLKYITSFGHSVLVKASSLIIDKKTDAFIYVVDTHDKCLKVFNFGFKYFGKIDIDIDLDWSQSCHIKGGIINGNLVLYDSNKMYIQAIDYSIIDDKSFKSETISEGFYVCKLNCFNHHFCRNPFLLPCGNIACLECIYDSYNLYFNKFVCSFDGCKVEHGLNGKIKELNITDENAKAICVKQTEYMKKCPEILEYTSLCFLFFF
jgi:hypothetical protein